MLASLERCLVVMSGGPDSVTAAYLAQEQGYEVHALVFNYGQKAQIEIEHAVKIANLLGISYKVVDLSELRSIYEKVTSLVSEDISVTSDFSEPLIVPFRNGVFLSVAVAHAVGIGAKRIFYGAHGSDEAFYPDCRRVFYKAFERAAHLGTDEEIFIEAPFSDMPKSEIIKKALNLGVPLQLTWSCYLNGPLHCGRCESCNNRKKSFKEAGLDDPTIYAG